MRRGKWRKCEAKILVDSFGYTRIAIVPDAGGSVIIGPLGDAVNSVRDHMAASPAVLKRQVAKIRKLIS